MENPFLFIMLYLLSFFFQPGKAAMAVPASGESLSTDSIPARRQTSFSGAGTANINRLNGYESLKVKGSKQILLKQTAGREDKKQKLIIILSILALVFGMLTPVLLLTESGLWAATLLAGLVSGIIALTGSKHKMQGKSKIHRAMAIAGIVLCGLVMAGLVVLFILFLPQR